MNKLATALLIPAIATVVIGCSSGSSNTDQLQNLSGRFEGTFENTEQTQDGTAVFNITQSENSDTVTGNALFDRDSGNECLISGTVTGTVTGFSASLTVGNANFQLSISDNNNTLSGTYVLTQGSEICSIASGSGNITVSRT